MLPAMARSTLIVTLVLLLVSCGGDDDADGLGVGAQCTVSGDCLSTDEFTQVCLTRFAGGYCGLASCTDDLDCPDDSGCVTHTDTESYCFRTCTNKVDCNANRTVENEANCSSNVTFVAGAQGRKACVPPSSGT